MSPSLRLLRKSKSKFNLKHQSKMLEGILDLGSVSKGSIAGFVKKKIHRNTSNKQD